MVGIEEVALLLSISFLLFLFHLHKLFIFSWEKGRLPSPTSPVFLDAAPTLYACRADRAGITPPPPTILSL